MDNIKATMDPYVQLLSSYGSQTKAYVLQANENLADLRSPLSQHKYLEPYYLIFFVLAYVLAVIIPRFQIKFHVTPWALLHHGISFVFSIFIPYHVIVLAMQSNYKVLCNSKPLDHRDLFAVQLGYIYGTFYIFKVYELFDVIIAKLEHKRLTPPFYFFQIANVVFAWLAAYFSPYGDAYIPVVINSIASCITHAAYVLRVAKWPLATPSEYACARFSMYVQCLLFLGLGIYEYINKCGYPETILLPFIGYNFLVLFYALVTNTNHVKQD